jgi:hypothetical protein
VCNTPAAARLKTPRQPTNFNRPALRGCCGWSATQPRSEGSADTTPAGHFQFSSARKAEIQFQDDNLDRPQIALESLLANMITPTDETSKPRQKTVFHASVFVMAFSWLLLSGGLVLIRVEGIGLLNAYTVLFLAVMVSAWAFIPLQIVRYFREKKNRHDG